MIKLVYILVAFQTELFLYFLQVIMILNKPWVLYPFLSRRRDGIQTRPTATDNVDWCICVVRISHASYTMLSKHRWKTWQPTDKSLKYIRTKADHICQCFCQNNFLFFGYALMNPIQKLSSRLKYNAKLLCIYCKILDSKYNKVKISSW